jgi:hypothetical protein
MPIVFPLLEFDEARVILAARGAAATVRVEILPSIVAIVDGGAPRTAAAIVTPPPDVVIAADDAAAVTINSATLPEGAGAVRLTATGDVDAAVGTRAGPGPNRDNCIDRQALSENGAGTQFRIPFVTDAGRTDRIRLAVTALGAARLVRIQSLQASFPNSEAGVPADNTLLWERDLTGSGTLLVVADGPVAVAAVIRRADQTRIRIYPAPI